VSRQWQVRPACTADAVGLARLEALIFGPDAWSEVAIEEELALASQVEASDCYPAGPAPAAAQVVVADDAVVAYGFLRLSGADADLLRLAVDPAARRHGIGMCLVDVLIDTARRRRCNRMLLEVAVDNVAARRFYGRLGFDLVDRRPRYYRGEVAALVLQKHL
jgi:[ribosomal protein S18]-alanine N-acetyltransferase